MTEWRPAPGFPKYEVSDAGEVRHVVTQVTRKLRVTTFGYVTVGLPTGEPRPYQRGVEPVRNKHIRVHRLVALAFIPNPEGLPQVNHKDLDKTNNRASNLEWVSQIENHEHARAAGVYDAALNDKRRKKLNVADVTKLREMRRSGLTLAECGAAFGILPCQAGRIVRGACWASVEGADPARRIIFKNRDVSGFRQRILEALPCHILEAARRTGASETRVFYELRAMEADGLVQSRREGCRRIYAAVSSAMNE